MHLFMLGTKLVLFWADTSEKLEKLKESSIREILLPRLRAGRRDYCTGQSRNEVFLRNKGSLPTSIQHINCSLYVEFTCYLA
jgi:hypothetical protein